MLTQNSILTYITGTPRATIGFAGRLAVRPEVLLGLRAPIDAAGELILHLAVIIHFLAAQIAARRRKLGSRSFGGVHALWNLCRRGRKDRTLHGHLYQLDLVAVRGERFRAVGGGFAAFAGVGGVGLRAV